jgi:hypothetical protein
MKFSILMQIFLRATHPTAQYCHQVLVRRYEIFDFDADIFKGDTPYGSILSLRGTLAFAIRRKAIPMIGVS